MTIVAVSTPGTKGFFQWLKRAMPQTYAGIKNELNFSNGTQLKGLGSFGAVDPATTASTAPPSSSLADTIKDLANTAAQAYLTTQQVAAQRQILTLQLQRAQAGLPPLAIDPTTYGLPQPSFGVSLDSGTKKIMIFGGIGLMLAIALGLIGGGRASRRT